MEAPFLDEMVREVGGAPSAQSGLNAIALSSSSSFFLIDDAHIERIFPGKKKTCYAFTFQMSDHLLIWIQIKTDIEGFRLDQIAWHY